MKGIKCLPGALLILIILLCISLCIICIIFPIVTVATSDGPILWFKRVNGEHVTFSRSGKLILTWRMSTLAWLNVQGDILFNIRVREDTFITHAVISPREDTIVVCYTTVTETLEGKEVTSVTVVAYDTDGEVVWNFTEKYALNGKVAFSPNGDYIALIAGYRKGDDRGAILEFLTAKGDILWKRRIHNGSTVEPSVCFTSKGIIASAGKKVIFVNNNGKIALVRELPSLVKAIDASVDGCIVAVIEHNMLHVYNDVGRELWNASTGTVLFYVDVSSDGKYIVIGGWKGAWCYDNDGRMLWSYIHGKDCVTPIAVSDNGYTIVADNSRFPTKAVLVRSDGAILWTLKLQKLGACFGVGITKDASLVAAGDSYGLYLLKGKEFKGTITPVSKRKVAEVVKVEKPPLLWILNCSDRLRGLQLIEDGSLLAVSEGWVHYVSSDGVIVWSKPVGPPLKAIATPDGEYVVVASLRRVSLLNKEGKGLWTRLVEGNVKALTPFRGGVAAVTWGNVHLFNLKGELGGSIKIPTPEKQQERTRKMIIAGTPWVLAKASPSGSIIAVAYGYRGSVLALVDVSNSESWTLWSMGLNTLIMDISLTNTKLILGLGNGTILAIDLMEKKTIWKTTIKDGRKAPIISVDVSENENYILANDKDGIVHLLSGDGRLLWSYPRESGKEFYFHSVLSRDGKYVIAAGSHIVILDHDGNVVWKIKLPEKGVVEKRLSITSDLKYLAVIATKNTVHYYKLSNILPQTTLQVEGEYTTIPYITLIVLTAVILLLIILMRRR